MNELVLDISKYDPDIDLAAWKSKHGLWGVIIKAGGNETGLGRYTDSWLERHYNNARAAGLHIGFYYYTVSTDISNAVNDAAHFAKLIGDKKYDLPCYMDVEDNRQFTLSASFDPEVKKRFLNKLLAPITDFLTIECVGHGQFLHDTTKEGKFLECFKKYNLKPEETLLVDDRIYNMYAALNVGVLPLRMRCPFTSDLPEELKWIHEIKNVQEVKTWLDNKGYLKPSLPSQKKIQE